MAKLMVTLRLEPQEANLNEVKRKLHLKRGEIDRAFGVISIKPEENLYTILVDEAIAQRIEGVSGVQGSFSNPKIEPFGPPVAK
jgi:hypothetical protein